MTTESRVIPIEDAAAAPAATATADLGQRAFGGAIWIVIQTLGSKTSAIIAQLILAALLTKGDFGQIAEVTLIVSLAGLSQQMGVSEILVQRHRNFRHWVNIAFWLNVTFGCIGAAAVAGLAPFTHLFFTDMPDLPKLLLVAAIGLPFDAVSYIAIAKMRIDLRFRTVALIGMCNVMGTAALSVAFAATRLIWPHSPVGGAMSLVLPKPIISLTVMIVSFYVSKLHIRMKPAVRRWRYILRDSRYFYVMTLFYTLLMNGDYLLVGLFFSKERLGAYYFAYNLSTQSAQLIANNFSGVLLPSFARLDREPERQKAAYLRVCSLVVLLGAMLCVIQGFTGGALLHLVYKSKWDEAIPLFQILTAGMVFMLPASAVQNLLQAQGRFKTSMVWAGIMAAFFLSSVGIGVSTHATKGVATADVIFFATIGVLNVVVPLGMKWKSVGEVLRRVYQFPVLAGLASALAALGVMMAAHRMSEPVQAALAASAAGAVYILLTLRFRPGEVRELMLRLQPILRRFSRRSRTA